MTLRVMRGTYGLTRRGDVFGFTALALRKLIAKEVANAMRDIGRKRAQQIQMQLCDVDPEPR
ncbi:hypothetical protein [Chitiniphilus shinanonensis]|uniref:hypothetical protein n=1 Tax=Chitiniphilus shinanonensis TaxID=553088 RepID=UPI0033424E78